MGATLSKDFDSWNELKKILEIKFVKSKPPLFNEREVWFVHSGVNVGHEIDGKSKLFLRPALILKKYNKNLFLAVFLSTSSKNNEYYLNIGNVAGKNAFVVLSQIKTLSANRLAYKIHKVSDKVFSLIVSQIIYINCGIKLPEP